MVLDTTLDFNLQLKNLKNKVNKTMGLLHNLDYGDIIYDREYNTSFHQNIESIQ